MVKYKVLYDFEALNEQEITVQKGELIKLQKTVCSDWSKVKLLKNNKSGLVPTNYIAEEGSLKAEDYYFYEISREEAKNLLENKKYEKGAFLIRESKEVPDRYVLSIKDRNWIYEHVRNYIKLLEPCSKEKPLIFREWEIKRNSIESLEEIGSGNFGVVHRGLMNGKTEVAIKQLKQDFMSTEDFLREANTMKLIRHDKLVALFGVCTDREPILIIQEFMPNGSLDKYLSQWRHNGCDNIYFAVQISSGMAYLECIRLVHGNLAARNVLVGHNKICKICDFGLIRASIDENYVPTEKGNMPIKWMAPESIAKKEFSIRSDVWSYGVLLMEIFTYGRVPYPGMGVLQVRDAVLNHEYRMENPSKYNIPVDIYEIMQNCWKTDPYDRPTFEYLNCFFQNYCQKSTNPYNPIRHS